MTYKVLADILVIVHFVWILFMLFGVLFNIICFWKKRFFDLWVFRTVHMAGIVYVGVLAAMGRYCPLTVWEARLRSMYSGVEVYPGSFIARYVERLVYPDVDIFVLTTGTLVLGIFTVIVFLVRPPEKIRKIFRFFIVRK